MRQVLTLTHAARLPIDGVQKFIHNASVLRLVATEDTTSRPSKDGLPITSENVMQAQAVFNGPR